VHRDRRDAGGPVDALRREREVATVEVEDGHPPSGSELAGDRFGVTTATCGQIDICLACTRGQRGDNRLQEHRDVPDLPFVAIQYRFV
jgi:hypothetical protein